MILTWNCQLTGKTSLLLAIGWIHLVSKTMILTWNWQSKCETILGSKFSQRITTPLILTCLGRQYRTTFLVGFGPNTLRPVLAWVSLVPTLAWFDFPVLLFNTNLMLLLNKIYSSSCNFLMLVWLFYKILNFLVKPFCKEHLKWSEVYTCKQRSLSSLKNNNNNKNAVLWQ